MKSILTVITVAVVMLLIGALFYGVYYAAGYLWNLYAELETVVRVVLLSTMSVVLIGATIISAAIKSSALSSRMASLVEEKLALYKLIVSLYQQYLTNKKQPAQQDATIILDSLNERETEIILLAGSTVLNLHRKLQAGIRDQLDADILSDLFQKLVKSIRRELGHGQNYDETKLKFLIFAEKAENTQRTGQSISL